MSEETTTAPARGRPRPDETKERDARVYEYLKAIPPAQPGTCSGPGEAAP